MRKSKRFPAFVAFFLCVAMILSLASSASTYTTYTSIDPQIASTDGCTGMQGFDAGSTYAYSIKVNTGLETKAHIYRTNISTGATSLMTNSNGTDYCATLYHANDLVLTTIGSEYCMFVATMNDVDPTFAFVKMTYSGNVYSRVGNYSIKLGGVDKKVTGVKILSKDATNITFLFKNARDYYTGTLPLNATSGTINLTYKFTVNANVTINGNNLTNYDNQGFEFYNNSVYHVLTEPNGGNVSAILVYRNISTASGTINHDPNVIFCIASVDYSKFEIEGCGIDGSGRLLFNTNRTRASDGVEFDGVHYMNTYVG